MLTAENVELGLPQMRVEEPDRIVTQANRPSLSRPCCKSMNSLKAERQMPRKVKLTSRSANLFGYTVVILGVFIALPSHDARLDHAMSHFCGMFVGAF